MVFSIPKIIEYYSKSIPYLLVTIEYVLISFVLSMILGGITARLKMSKRKVFRWLANAYLTVMRCVPPVVLLFIVYFMIPAFLLDVFGIQTRNIPIMIDVVFTFSLMNGALCAEAIRSAYESISKGQMEAALASGLTPVQGIRYVVFPQMLKESLPNLCNILISLLKEGSIAYTIGFIDIFGRVMSVGGKDGGVYVLCSYIVLTIIYWPITVCIEKLTALAEKRLSFGREDEGVKA